MQRFPEGFASQHLCLRYTKDFVKQLEKENSIGKSLCSIPREIPGVPNKIQVKYKLMFYYITYNTYIVYTQHYCDPHSMSMHRH